MYLPFYAYFFFKNLYLKNYLKVIKLVLISSFFTFIFFIYFYKMMNVGYVQVASSGILNFENFFQNLYSIFIEAKGLFNNNKDMLLNKMPWLVFYPLSLLFFIFKKNIIFIIINIAVIINFSVYLSFGPINSVSLWIWGTPRNLILALSYFSALSFIAIFKLYKDRAFKQFAIYCTVFVTLSIFAKIFNFGIQSKQINSATEIYSLDNKIIFNSRPIEKFNKITITGLQMRDVNTAHDPRLYFSFEDEEKCFIEQINYNVNISSNRIDVVFHNSLKVNKLQITLDKKIFEKKNELKPFFSLTSFCIFCEKNSFVEKNLKQFTKFQKNKIVNNFDTIKIHDDFKKIIIEVDRIKDETYPRALEYRNHLKQKFKSFKTKCSKNSYIVLNKENNNEITLLKNDHLIPKNYYIIK